VIGLMTEWTRGNEKETRMADGRSGAAPCGWGLSRHADAGVKGAEVYGATQISERHRHRYEVNTRYVKDLAGHGMTVSGWSPDGSLPEIMEFRPSLVHRVQFHRMKSRPLERSLFTSFISAACGRAASSDASARPTPRRLMAKTV